MGPEAAQLLRGIGRGVTADPMGGPVDIATMMTNLLIAGGGYGAHKLGLIDSPPDLIDPKTVPFSSDWLVKGTPLAGEGGTYEMGRLLPALATLPMAIAGGTKRVPGGKTRQKQAGALYLDKQGNPGAEDLALYHNTDLGKYNDVASDRTLPSELRNLSQAITSKNRKLVSQFGDNYLVPRPQSFEPRTSPSVLKATDFYTLRKDKSFEGLGPQGFDTLALGHPQLGPMYNNIVDEGLKSGLGVSEARKVAREATQEAVRALRAVNRLEDRTLQHKLPAGGAGGEIYELSQMLKQVEDSGNIRDAARALKGNVAQQPFQEHILSAPQFRSFESFDKSAKGAGRLRSELKQDPEALSGTLKSLRLQLETHGLEIPNRATIGQLRDVNWVKKNLWFDDPELANLRRLTPSEASEVASLIRKQAVKSLDYAPSEYAELKRYGPIQLNKDNFAAFISRGSRPANPEIIQQLEQRGIPHIDATGGTYSDSHLFDLITEIQTQALRNRGK